MMASASSNRELEEVDVSEPLLSDADADADAVVDAQQLQTHLASAKAARRWRRIRIAIGTITLLALIGIFVRLSRWRRPFDFVSHKQPQFFPEYESQRVQIRYGPFKVPGRGHHNGKKDFNVRDAKAPCQDCMIVWMQAGLEYLDRRYAGVEEGMWLHHTVLHNDAKAAVHNCDKEKRRQRFFASGNERSVVDLSGNGTEKIGYFFSRDDTITMATELMNGNKKAQTAVLTITYEYIPYLPEDFSIATPIWLDIGGCHSELPVPPDNTSFEFESPAWKATINGRVANVINHLHDGGVKIELQRDREDVCVSEAEYEMESKSKGHKHGMEMSHITNMSKCHDVGRMTVGEQWAVKAQYDLGKHEPMLDEHGKPEPVMGIAVVYVVED